MSPCVCVYTHTDTIYSKMLALALPAEGPITSECTVFSYLYALPQLFIRLICCTVLPLTNQISFGSGEMKPVNKAIIL